MLHMILNTRQVSALKYPGEPTPTQHEDEMWQRPKVTHALPGGSFITNQVCGGKP